MIIVIKKKKKKKTPGGPCLGFNEGKVLKERKKDGRKTEREKTIE